MNARALYFTAPRAVEVRPLPLNGPGPGQLLVETRLSAISAGTEMLIYRGLAPKDMQADAALGSLPGGLHFPLRYGYAAVGVVVEAGDSEGERWLGRHVFSFQPHQSHFLAPAGDLHPIPAGIAPEAALMLPNMETAVSLTLDGGPRIGERALVLGQGVVGLLTTSLLGRFPLESLVTLERLSSRRAWSQDLGAHLSLDPSQVARAAAALGAPDERAGADLTYELTGDPGALDLALELTGFHGRVIIGSWYGEKRAAVNLGGRFHRSRIRLVSSQVSTLAPERTGRWSKRRQLALAWEMTRDLDPAAFITHRFPLEEAARAYELLDRQPEEALQILLTYAGS